MVQRFFIQSFTVAFSALLISFFPITALADSAPAVRPGATIKSLKDEDIQLKEEYVTIDITNKQDKFGYEVAHVKVEFKMYNFGSSKAIDVGFPLEDLNTLQLGDLFPPENFQAIVNGTKVATNNVELNEGSWGDDWIAWQAVFNSGENTIITEYDIKDSGYQGITFYYVLETGQGWKNNIEKADITINFPSEFNLLSYQEHGFFEKQFGIISPLFIVAPTGYKIKKNSIQWIINNFEPRHEDNIVVTFNSAKSYNTLVTNLDNFDADSFASYLNLGNAYLPFSDRCHKTGGYCGFYGDLTEKYFIQVGNNSTNDDERALANIELVNFYLENDWEGNKWSEVQSFLRAAETYKGDDKSITKKIQEIKNDERYTYLVELEKNNKQNEVATAAVAQNNGTVIPVEEFDKDVVPKITDNRWLLYGSYIANILLVGVVIALYKNRK